MRIEYFYFKLNDMARAENYVKVFWLEEPRSADTVLKTAVVPCPGMPILIPGQTRQVMWGRECHPARIILTGKCFQ